MNLKSLILLVTTATIISISVCSCKTTEANYRAAYEAAKTGDDESIGSEEAEQLRRSQLPDSISIEGVKIPIKRIAIYPAEAKDLPKSQLERFNVAVAKFKQVFNARSMATRLRDRGFEEACIARDREENYYVLAKTTNSAKEADKILKELEKEREIVISQPFPYVILR